jgi:hypothetical protein
MIRQRIISQWNSSLAAAARSTEAIFPSRRAVGGMPHRISCVAPDRRRMVEKEAWHCCRLPTQLSNCGKCTRGVEARLKRWIGLHMAY